MTGKEGVESRDIERDVQKERDVILNMFVQINVSLI